MNDTSYQGNLKLMKGIAARVLRRCRSTGSSIQLEDILQELAIAWMKAVEAFDPERGVPFGAFLTRGCWLHINRWVEEELGHLAYSLDQTFTQDSDGELHDVIPDTARPSDEVVIEEEIRACALGQLSPRARMFYELLENPDPELMREVEAIQARAAFARSRGIATIAVGYLSAAHVFDLMDAPRRERNEIVKEIRSIGKVIQL